MQIVPKAGHCTGLSCPRSTSPARHSAGSFARDVLEAELPHRVVVGELLAQREPAQRDLPDAAPLPVGELEDLLHQRLRRDVPLAPHRAHVLVLDARRRRPRAGAPPSASPRAGPPARSPVTTIGTWYVAAIGSYSVKPITVHTCPAARKACTRLSGAPRMASIAGGTVTCDTSTREVRHAQLARPPHRHRVRRRRRLEADREEDDLLIGILDRELERVERRVDDAHVPAARAHLEEIALAPRHAQHVAEARAASRPAWRRACSARSICSSGVTHTGQPGPWTISTAPSGSSSSPCFTIVCVCPPHTSIIVQERVAVCADLLRERAGDVRVAVLGEVPHGRASAGSTPGGIASFIHSSSSSWLISRSASKVRCGLGLVHLRDREAHVHDHVVADLHLLLHVRETDVAAHAAEVHRAHGEFAVAVEFNDPAGDAETHGGLPRSMGRCGAIARQPPPPGRS